MGVRSITDLAHLRRWPRRPPARDQALVRSGSVPTLLERDDRAHPVVRARSRGSRRTARRTPRGPAGSERPSSVGRRMGLGGRQLPQPGLEVRHARGGRTALFLACRPRAESISTERNRRRVAGEVHQHQAFGRSIPSFDQSAVQRVVLLRPDARRLHARVQVPDRRKVRVSTLPSIGHLQEIELGEVHRRVAAGAPARTCSPSTRTPCPCCDELLLRHRDVAGTCTAADRASSARYARSISVRIVSALKRGSLADLLKKSSRPWMSAVLLPPAATIVGV